MDTEVIYLNWKKIKKDSLESLSQIEFKKLKESYLAKIKESVDTLSNNTTEKNKTSFWNRLLKKDNDTDDNEDDKNALDESVSIDRLIAEYNNLHKLINFEEYPKNSIIYDFYINIAHSKISSEEIQKNLQDFPEIINDLLNESQVNEIGLIYTVLEKYSINDIHEIINGIIESKVDEAQSSYYENQKAITEYKSRENSLFENLSEKAKEYHNKFSSEFSLSNFNNLTDNSLSPLIASLILETIFYIDDIKTPDDIHKFGISFTDEEIKEYKELINNTILPNMENFLDNSINIILVKNHN